MKQKNLRLFYIHQAFFSFTDSLWSVTFPIFIYQLFHSISALFVWLFVWNAMYGVLFIPLFNAGMKWGKPKVFMALGVLFYGISLIFTGKTTPEHVGFIIPAVITFGLYLSFYWMVRHWFFSVNSDHAIMGKQISWIAIINMVVSFLGPIIGGTLSQLVSFNAAFLLGSISMILSIIPVLLFHAPPHPERYTFHGIRAILRKPELHAIRGTYFWEGMSNYFISAPWILAFGIFLGNVKQLGILVGFSTVISVILTRLTGHFFDLKKRITLLEITTKLKMTGALLYASIYFFPAIAYVWTVDILNRFVGSMHGTVTDSYLYATSNKIHPIYFHLNREIHLVFARALSALILGITFYFLPATYLWLSIALGGFMTLGWLHLKRSDHLLR